jgi:hypothetical protein
VGVREERGRPPGRAAVNDAEACSAAQTFHHCGYDPDRDAAGHPEDEAERGGHGAVGTPYGGRIGRPGGFRWHTEGPKAGLTVTPTATLPTTPIRSPTVKPTRARAGAGRDRRGDAAITRRRTVTRQRGELDRETNRRGVRHPDRETEEAVLGRVDEGVDDASRPSARQCANDSMFGGEAGRESEHEAVGRRIGELRALPQQHRCDGRDRPDGEPADEAEHQPEQ